MSASHRPSEASPVAAVTRPSTPPRRLDAAVLRGAHRVAGALTEGGEPGSRDEWFAMAGDCQSLINTLTAVQDTALAEAARRESDWCEDGTLGETLHRPGRVVLDAADLAAPVLGASHAQAQRRVELAVRLAVAREPVPADGRATPDPNGLGGVHTAMAEGRLDGYRASVIVDELALAPAEVAEAIVSALDDHLHDDAPSLRRRTRRLVARISPDLLRQRAQRARTSTGLRRWVSEPGVDAWFGTFPSEDAAAAWAAIDRLAHDLVADGTCSNIEQARGRALTDLVISNATIDVQVVLTVPADTEPADGDSQRATTAAGCGERSPHKGAAAASATASARPDGHDDLVQVQGARPSEPLLVRRDWLRDRLATQTPAMQRREAVRPPFVPCDPLTGARLDPDDHLATEAYRPGAELAALVRARDGRCRFPGCSVAARFCDLDHVRPWPTGPTTADNLLTLCRRHHRIKQRPGWRARLAPDGTATWTDPAGRDRTTAPLDALETVLLRSDPAEAPASGATDDRPRHPSVITDDATSTSWSSLETVLMVRVDHHRAAVSHQRRHRRCTSAADLRDGFARHRARAPVPDEPPF